MLKAPRRFREVVATIRDDASREKAAPELKEVVQQFHRSAAAFRALAPPDEAERAKYRQMIAEGWKNSPEPTAEDLLNLIFRKGREDEVVAWFEEFAAAGGEAWKEAERLYGKIEVPRADDEKRAEKQMAEQLEKKLGEGLRAEMRDLQEKQPALPAVPLESGDNPLLRHLDGPGSSDE